MDEKIKGAKTADCFSSHPDHCFPALLGARRRIGGIVEHLQRTFGPVKVAIGSRLLNLPTCIGLGLLKVKRYAPQATAMKGSRLSLNIKK